MTPAPQGIPPSPWHLTGDMISSVWQVPQAELPSWPLPRGVRPWVARKRCTLVTFWVDYQPGGVLTYREFLITLAVWHRRRLAASTVAAWVDNEQALVGGRTLWGIPKHMGTITLHKEADSTRSELTGTGTGTTAAVRAVHRDMLRLPFRLPARAHLVQELPDGTTCRVPLRIQGRPTVGRTEVEAAPTPALSFLTNRRPLLSLAVRGFHGTVGYS
ncbi:acetoacetate decarboxylase family protein [Streptomyces sp. NPDC001351]|uniref:acetoacetate decarboxylase family protein n=1 Tax=Streptomyces sp. NPDC001351 TaxID=3364564 RepID=UPI0036A7959F